MKKELTHGALFQGIGGFSLAARNQGIPTIWECENNKYCQKLSLKNFPEIKKRFGDIKEMLIEKDKINPVSIISAGFPCQPFSTAGKRNGEKDNRYLWPETLEIIKHVRPRWVILENVPGIINMVLGNIIIDLESAGYRLPVSVDKRKIVFNLPAIAVGANHIRQRVWVIAYNDRINGDNTGLRRTKVSEPKKTGIQRPLSDSPKKYDRENLSQTIGGQVQQFGISHIIADMADAEPTELQGIAIKEMEKSKIITNNRKPFSNSERGGRKAGRQEAGQETGQAVNGFSGETRSPVANADNSAPTRHRKHGRETIQKPKTNEPGKSGESMADTGSQGLPWTAQTELGKIPGKKEESEGSYYSRRITEAWKHWAVEPGVGRVAHGVPSRVDRLRGLGNAIVPQVAEVFFNIISRVENNLEIKK